jgi:intracellular sulfur oxidation DsrE/DsrF family protein
MRAGSVLWIVAVSLLAMPASAQDGARLIPDFGAYRDIPDAFERPDPTLKYRIVFDVSQPARAADKVHQGLERAARIVNLLAVHGIKIEPGDIVVTMHGQAGRAALSDAAHKARFKGEANPNERLINQLTAAGISVRLCGQSMVGAGFTRAELNPDVKVDVAAITTMTTLQLRGYAVVQD